MAKKKKKKDASTINVKDRFNNIKVLVQSGRPKEAIAYIYLVYTDLINNKFKKARLAHQTIREYGITCVNELGQKPENTYPFLKRIEDIIYGGIEPGEKEFKTTIELFSNLHKDITGNSISFSL
jgi:hypothetical protein